MHHWCHLGPCTYGGGKHMSALQSAMNENNSNREPTNIALALHNQVLATEGQPPHQVGHPEYTQDLPLEGPPMPILSKTPAPPQANPPLQWGAIGIIEVALYRSLLFTQSQLNFVLLLQWPSDVSDELFSFPTAKVCTHHIDSSNWMILSLPFSLLLHLHMPQKGIIMFMWELAKPLWRGVIVTPVIIIIRCISAELRIGD